MYQYLTLMVLFESCLCREYKYRPRKKCRCIVITTIKMSSHGLSAVITQLMSSTRRAEKQLHWLLLIWSLSMYRSIYGPVYISVVWGNMIDSSSNLICLYDRDVTMGLLNLRIDSNTRSQRYKIFKESTHFSFK